MKTVTLTAILNTEESAYVALCPELDIASQGETVEEAVANLKEAVEGFMECADTAEIHQRLKKPSLLTHFEVACA
ncbi:type II toxin-antitoxin system HicB family antitoxin [Kamptonema cortianum]|nr:type II toxin-antitoxin system HicB family antitoxin [Kamptonema cortianum]MDL5047181.1 type II toxin-antitoxin system HicB family antitoxin [Oscillatoria amoena NRMC-F 0135]